MVTFAENELMTRVEGDAPMGSLIRENYWIPFAMADHLAAGDAPLPVRLLGENYVAFRDVDGRIGFLDERCPHRRASLVLARSEGDGIRCIYHGWKIDAAGSVVDCPSQTIRPQQFAARVPVKHFPVIENGGLAWVWLGGGDAPAVPALPFSDMGLYRTWCVSRIACNWLQGVEGSIDSMHAGVLHQTWIAEAAKLAEHSNLNAVRYDVPPVYETRATPYGMSAAAVRAMGDGGSYARITEHLMPFVSVVPVGGNLPDAGSVFVVAPVDDTHHLFFFGTYGPSPHSAASQKDIKMQADSYLPDPFDFCGLQGDRTNRWGQDRELMKAGHFTGFGRSLLEEDAAIQTSMGPIVDRSQEFLSSSDVAVAHARRMLLDALAGATRGELPPGSARTPGGITLPNCVERVLHDGERWDEPARDPAGV
jgi:phenylpropionate dioxygenase-like ring-hydroxylating dioxygenase large terminal subunit